MQFRPGQGATLERRHNGKMEEINARGGMEESTVGGKKMKIELVQADSNEFLNVTDATNAMELLMTRHKVDFVVGGFRTEAVLAMQDIAMEYKKIFIGVRCGAPELCLRVAKITTPTSISSAARPSTPTIWCGPALFTCLRSRGSKVSTQYPDRKGGHRGRKGHVGRSHGGGREKVLPKFGMEVAGVWRPSPVATDVTAELSAIQRSGAQ
jgi:branched-chain amino acid transport system substrate-binding protein